MEISCTSTKISRTCSSTMWYCTPGMLVAAKALLDKNPSPTETEIRFWLAGTYVGVLVMIKLLGPFMPHLKKLRRVHNE